MKSTSWKKSKSRKTKLHTVLTLDEFNFIIAVVSYSLEDILQRNEAKKQTMYEKIEAELRRVQQALHFSRTVSTMSPPSEEYSTEHFTL
jgi:hypothetical protein